MRALTTTSTTCSLKRVHRTDIDFEHIVEEPFRAILLHSPGRKPWVNHWLTFIEPQRGGTSERINSNARVVVPLQKELNLLLSMRTQGFISGFALITPWALRECRPYRALCILLSVRTQGFIAGFALITPWALKGCRPCRAHLRYPHQSIS